MILSLFCKKELEISNLCLIRGIAGNIKLEILIVGSKDQGPVKLIGL
jgi:hypothetical protein